MLFKDDLQSLQSELKHLYAFMRHGEEEGEEHNKSQGGVENNMTSELPHQHLEEALHHSEHRIKYMLFQESLLLNMLNVSSPATSKSKQLLC